MASKLPLLYKVYVTLLLVVFGGIVVHAPLVVAVGWLFGDLDFSLGSANFELLIKSWKEVLLGAALVIGLILMARMHMWKILKTPLIYAMGLFAIINVLIICIMYISGDVGINTKVVAAALLINLRYFLFFGLVYVAVSLYPETRRMFVYTFLVGAAVVMGFAVLQVTVLPADILKYIGYGPDTIQPYLTVDQNQAYVRINSTLRGPNPLGAYAAIVLAACASLWLLARKRLIGWRSWAVLALGAGALVALWASYSRSAAVAAAVALVVVVLVRFGVRWGRVVWLGLLAAGLVLAGGLYVFRDTTLVSQVILHEDPSEGGEVNSNEGHAYSLADGLRRVATQPFGAGIGSTGSPSLLGSEPLIIENQYLYVAHETGWIGLGLFLYIQVKVLLMAWQRRRDWLALAVFASGVGLCLIGLLLPVWADDTVDIIWWGLAAVALAGARSRPGPGPVGKKNGGKK